MSFLSAQGSNAVFNNTVVNDLTVNGELILVNGSPAVEVPENVELLTITSPDGTNEIDLSVPHEINYNSDLHNFRGNIDMKENAIENVFAITSADESSTIDLSVTNEISYNSTNNNFLGDIHMNNHHINNVGLITGEGGLVTIDAGSQLYVKGYGGLVDCKVQGAYFDWNDTGDGQTNLVNNRGGGHGGFNFYNVATDSAGNVDQTTTAEIVFIDEVGAITTFATTESTSVSTGALIVKGGVGIAKKCNIAGITDITNTTNSTASTNGALIVGGGVGVAKDLYVAGNIHCTGTVSSADTNLYQEFHSVIVGGNSGTITGTINLNVPQGNTNYAVFSSIYDNLPGGSGGTYNSADTSNALHAVIIQDITQSSFQYMVAKSTGNNVNLTICFMVIFSSTLNYNKASN